MIGVDRLLSLIAGVERTATALDIARAMASDAMGDTTPVPPARPPQPGSTALNPGAGLASTEASSVAVQHAAVRSPTTSSTLPTARAGLAFTEIDPAAVEHAAERPGGPVTPLRAHTAAATLLGLRPPSGVIDPPEPRVVDEAGDWSTGAWGTRDAAARARAPSPPIQAPVRMATADGVAAGSAAGSPEIRGGPLDAHRPSIDSAPLDEPRPRPAVSQGLADALSAAIEAGPEPTGTSRAAERAMEAAWAALGSGGPGDPQTERAGVIASFILNAAMIPGWPGKRNFEPVAVSKPARAPDLPRLGATIEGDFLRYVAAMGVLRAIVSEIEQALRSARRRLRLLLALAILLTRVKLALRALAEARVEGDEDDPEAELAARRWTG